MRTNDVARHWAEAINARDLGRVLSLAHPDIECQPLKLSPRGVHRGHVGLADWIVGGFISTPPAVRVRIERIQTLSTERVAGFGTIQSDETETFPYALLAIVRDGKVAAMRSYLADEPTMDQLGLLD